MPIRRETQSAQAPGGENRISLGLAILRHIAVSQSGRIWIETEIGTGSIFSLSACAGRNSSLRNEYFLGESSSADGLRE